MSIYATNFLVDEETGEVTLVKHLNKIKVNRWTLAKTPGGWNKSGRKSRVNKGGQLSKLRDRRETRVDLRKLNMVSDRKEQEDAKIIRRCQRHNRIMEARMRK